MTGRGLAAALLLLAAVARETIAQDALVLRDGNRRQGRLSACTDSGCQLDSAAVPLPAIAWIGLGVGGAAPPPAAALDGDAEAWLRNGERRRGRFVGVSLGVVALDETSLERDEVAWVQLARLEPSAPQEEPVRAGERSGGGPPAPPAAAPPASPPLPPPPAPPDVPPFGSPGAGPGTPGATWRGTILGRYVVEDPGFSYQINVFSAELRGRERIYPLVVDGSTVWEQVLIQPEEISIADTYRSTEFFAGGASCQGTGRQAGNPSAAFGWIGRKRANIDLTPYLGYDLPPDTGLYLLTLHPAFGSSYPVSCASPSVSWSRDESVPGVWIGKTLDNPFVGTALTDPEPRYSAGGRMFGSYETSLSGYRSAVSWSFCREGEECPPPAPLPTVGPPEAEDPCGDLAAERALADVLWQQREAYTRDLEAEWNALKEAHGAMLDDFEAYKAMIDACAIADIVTETMESSSGWGGEFVEFVTKILSGDLSWVVGDEFWGPLAERAWDAFPRHADWAANMRARLDACNAPLPADLRRAAARFVDNWERVRQLMPTVQEKLNRVRDKDLRYWEQWNRFYRVCLEWAECKGAPPTSCPQPPEQPTGPMPAPPG